MEDGLVQCMTGANSLGRKGLNPYCSGQWSRTDQKNLMLCQTQVLILIVVDNGLVPTL